MAKSTRKTKKPNSAKSSSGAKRKNSAPAKYPRHSVAKALRIPKAVLDQNGGRPCTVQQSATYLGVGYAGPYQVEVSSGIKYGFLDRPEPGEIAVTDRAKRVLRPQNAQDKLDGLREAVLAAPVISDVYSNYRGENLPDAQFFQNALPTSLESRPTRSLNSRISLLNH